MGGVGLAYTNIAGRDLSKGFQFNLQGGAGTHYFLRGNMALTFRVPTRSVGERWFHLSNAGLNVPNSGPDAQMLFAGMSRFY